jgi:hypothetical protein
VGFCRPLWGQEGLLNLAYKLGNAKFRCPEGKAKFILNSSLKVVEFEGYKVVNGFYGFFLRKIVAINQFVVGI